MQSTTYRSAFVDGLLAEGRAESEARGRVEGRAEGEANSILRVLARRGIEPTPEQTRQILACLDTDQLNL